VDLNERLASWRAARRSIEAAVVALATSADGARFSWQAPVGAEGLVPGGYAAIEREGERLLGQLVEAGMQERAAAELGMAVDAESLGLGAEAGQLQVTRTLEVRALAGTGAILGRLAGGAFEPGAGSAPFLDAALRPATTDEVGAYLATAQPRGLAVGTARFGPPDVPARLDPAGFARHTFLCGQSGSGKTYSLGVVLERLLVETDLRIVVLDPNSDFVRLGEPAGDDPRYREVAGSVRVLRAPSQGDGAPLGVRIDELSAEARAAVLRMDPLADREEYDAFLELFARAGAGIPLGQVRRLLAAEPSPAAQALALRIGNLGVLDWEIWQTDRPEPTLAQHLDAGDWRALVVDIGTLGHRGEIDVAAEAALGHLWERRMDRRPVLIVIDEAHNLCPAQPGPWLAESIVEHCVRIAGEGRKFGLHMLVVTQRPAKVHPNVLTQCENLLLMRVNSAADLVHLAEGFSHVPPSLVAQASSFGLGQSLAAGRIAPQPTLLRFGARLSREGGGDVPTDWIRR
jgi:DNA helicase HerA-like ATPase